MKRLPCAVTGGSLGAFSGTLRVSFNRIYFNGSNCELSLIRLGTEGKPAMVLLHGMRDHGLSLYPLAEAFGADFDIFLPDLRGHGGSHNPGSYAMVQFVADLHALVTHFGLERLVLVGHSLGGHIAARYAGGFPEKISRLILLDGMGPPKPAEPLSPEAERQQYRETIEQISQLSSQLKPMADNEDAYQRLRRNNPNLSEEAARRIADFGVEPHTEGGVRWRWDPAVQMVWQTFSHDETEALVQHIDAPVLIVTGEFGKNYWTGMRHGLEIATQHYEAELERRRQLFPDARHEVIPGAGHMIHYDQPEALIQRLAEFLAA
ncbi:MAG: alpha/beta hydrolase [Pseudomonadales bacterium]|nr:alpha/beta hydrolase [Pseudomonadales bacterium]